MLSKPCQPTLLDLRSYSHPQTSVTPETSISSTSTSTTSPREPSCVPWQCVVNKQCLTCAHTFTFTFTSTNCSYSGGKDGNETFHCNTENFFNITNLASTSNALVCGNKDSASSKFCKRSPDSLEESYYTCTLKELPALQKAVASAYGILASIMGASAEWRQQSSRI